MLVISRKVGESLFISEDIRITVVSTSGDKVSLAIDAPKDIKIIREELLETIQSNKDSSESSAPSNFVDLAQLLKNKKTL